MIVVVLLLSLYLAEKHHATSSCQHWEHHHEAQHQPSKSVTAWTRSTQLHVTLNSDQQKASVHQQAE